MILKPKLSDEFLVSDVRENAYGAPGESRTPTPIQAIDFESTASTSSATGALWAVSYRQGFLRQQESVLERSHFLERTYNKLRFTLQEFHNS